VPERNRKGCDTIFTGLVPDETEKFEMSKKVFPRDVIEQAQEVLVGWGQITPALTFGTLTPTLLQADITAAAPLEAEIVKLRNQLAEKCGQRDMLYYSMWDKLKRTRAGVKAIYGDDSQQYEWVGGTRMSDRKLRARKGSTPTTSA
jgi:hypothetical protein